MEDTAGQAKVKKLSIASSEIERCEIPMHVGVPMQSGVLISKEGAPDAI